MLARVTSFRSHIGVGHKEVLLWMFFELLAGMLVLVGVILVLLVIGSLRRQARKRELPITATVTETHYEAPGWRSNWCVTAEWRDVVTGQTHTVRSRSKYRPKQRGGDTVTVICNPNRPKRFRMEL